MPTYDYLCKQCGHQFETFQSITAEPLAICPECGGPVKRLVGAGAGLIFKGSGFYITDYKKSGNGKKEKSGSHDSAARDKKTETPKPETKSSGS